DAARAAGTKVIASSIRDILQERAKPERLAETVTTLRRSFDLVLVHGGGISPPLDETFGLTHEITDLIRYTGIVGPPAPPVAIAGHDLVVSAGGGAVGYPLLASVLAALPLSVFRDSPVIAVAGPQMPEDHFTALGALASPNIRLLRSVPDLPGLFAGAKLSVSQAGYNTVAEIMAAGCRAVLCPFVGDGQTEQAIRAGALARTGRCQTVHEAGLTPARMAAAMEAAFDLPQPSAQIADGAARAAAVLLERLERSRDFGR
ncbi:MAG: glycosyltransferase family protein, partial [Beijerinckiaceae bacterium]